MKIFNWVHKRFHRSALTDGFASNSKKVETTMNNVEDSQALLKQVALAEVFGGWNDGILAIGTLGYDSLKPFSQQKEYLALESEGEQYEVEGEQYLVGDDEEGNYNVEYDEELNPLMHATFGHNYEDVVTALDANASKEVLVMSINEILLHSPVISHEVTKSNSVEADEKKKKGERITLADLFLADSDVKVKFDPAKVLQKSSKKQSLKAKHGLTFAKKLFPLVKENTHPIKHIRKLMKKMLKKKIHPELDAKNHKPEEQKLNAAGIIDNNKHEATNDSTSLLSI